MKDNFSSQSSQYAKFRPTYPKELYNFIFSHVTQTHSAWDCATGNGQVAIVLAQTFDQVFATDISAKQLAQAPQVGNVIYKVEPAENTRFEFQSFDLITVAQALHWFKFDAYFAEVKRLLKPEGLFVAIGYGLMKINPEIDQIVNYLYKDILGTYWDPERKHIEDGYQNIPFPFEAIESPNLAISTRWNFNQLVGYLETWSSLQHYLHKNDKNPIAMIDKDLKKAWGDTEYLDVRFPLIIKAGKLK